MALLSLHLINFDKIVQSSPRLPLQTSFVRNTCMGWLKQPAIV